MTGFFLAAADLCSDLHGNHGARQPRQPPTVETLPFANMVGHRGAAHDADRLRGITYGPIAAFLVELFPTSIRYTSMSLPYHLGLGWFGGFLPLIATATTSSEWAKTMFGSNAIYAGFIYACGVCLMTAIIGTMLHQGDQGSQNRCAALAMRARATNSRGSAMHPDLSAALEFHEAVLAEGGKALIGYDKEKALANVVLMAEIPTSYDKGQKRQVNSGNLLLRGVPGVGKTFFGVILAAISDAKFARIQGRADLQPAEVVGFQMINPATGEFITEFGPLASAEIILLDEINRIPVKSQSAFLEGLQDRTVTVGKTTYELPEFSFALATMNPVELGQGTFPLSEAATDRFAIIVNVRLPTAAGGTEARQLRLQEGRLRPLAGEGAHHRAARGDQPRSLSARAIANYIRRLVARRGRSTPPPAGTGVRLRTLVEKYVELGASPRATICWGRLVKVWALLQRRRDKVLPEDVQDLARYVLGHRVWLAPQAASQDVTVEAVIDESSPAWRCHERGRQRFVLAINPPTCRADRAFLLRRMREYAAGDHASVIAGTGFNMVGLREWEPGDAMSIDRLGAVVPQQFQPVDHPAARAGQ